VKKPKTSPAHPHSAKLRGKQRARARARRRLQAVPARGQTPNPTQREHKRPKVENRRAAAPQRQTVAALPKAEPAVAPVGALESVGAEPTTTDERPRRAGGDRQDDRAGGSAQTYLKVAAAILLPVVALVAWQIDSRRLRESGPKVTVTAVPPPMRADTPAAEPAAEQTSVMLTDTEIARRIAAAAPATLPGPLPGELSPPPEPIIVKLALPMELPTKGPDIPLPEVVIQLALPMELPTKGPHIPLPDGEITSGALAVPAEPPAAAAAPDIRIALALPMELPTQGPLIPLPDDSIALAAVARPSAPPADPAPEITIKLALPLQLPTTAPHILLPDAPPLPATALAEENAAAAGVSHMCSLPDRASQSVSVVPPGSAATQENFGSRLAAVAAAQTKEFVIYSARYTPIAYPMGDVATLLGSCTDVVIRAYRALGIDLQELVYKSRSGVGDRSIDHRRTETLRRFFATYGTSVPITDFHENYQPGDIVTYYRPHSRVSTAHIAVVSSEIAPSGRPMIIHNRGWGTQIEDALFVDRITGHYRFSGLQMPLLAERPKATPQLPNPPVVRPSPAAYAAMGTGALAPVPVARQRTCGGPEYTGLLKARPVACPPVAPAAAASGLPVPRQASRATGAVLAK
jgi:uncharacterized protein YijF (DUF1287 family)